MSGGQLGHRASGGFTMIELVTVMIILGVLAVVALPSLSGSSLFQSTSFNEQVRDALRYAQKAAVSHRRMVCATLTATTVTLTIATNFGDAACSATTLNGPNGSSAYAISPKSSITLSPTGSIYFEPSGMITTDANDDTGSSPYNGSITVSGTGTSIALQGLTGYVY
jgi:MSHA pilin protein MshC